MLGINSGVGPAELSRSAIRFGPFRLLPTQQILLEGERPVLLGSRALAILSVLVVHAGNLVTKASLMAAVWPGLTVEEVNLRVHVSALRRALGDGQQGRRYIATSAGRGYQFIGPITIEQDDLPASAALALQSPQPSLPVPQGRMVGRSDVMAAILGQLQQRRFVTLVGPGGIGKTTVAIAAARDITSAYPDGVHFVDFASVARPELLPAAIAMAMGLPILSDDPLPGLVASIRDRSLLLVLDCCDRVVDSAALLIERLLTSGPGIHVLATSREPLRAEGERIIRLPPLGLPPMAGRFTAAEAMAFPAIQLFAERAADVTGGFELTDAEAPIVVEICSRLDGVALAIEMAAGHMAVFDLRSIAALLNDRFRILQRGRRTALPRHQTMRATLDWSYDTLSQTERLVLQRLALFDGSMSLQAVEAVAGDTTLPAADVIVCLCSLIDRSLVSAEIDETGARYRLLDTTRAYAAERLAQNGEQSAIARRHAEFHLQLLQTDRDKWATLTDTDLRQHYRQQIGNVRVALDWAFSPSGDPQLAITLSVVAVPILFDLSLAEECRRRALQALGVLELGAEPDDRAGMRLRAALAAAQMYNPGPGAQTIAEWQRVLEHAAVLGDVAVERRALWGLWTAHSYGGLPRKALELAERLWSLAAEQSDATRQLTAERVIGISLHYLGRQNEAKRCLEGMLSRYISEIHRVQTLGSQIDHRPMAQATLARIYWVLGQPGLALRTAQSALAQLRPQGHAISFCYALFEAAIPIALMVGDWELAGRSLDELGDFATRSGLVIWEAGERCARLALRSAQGGPLRSHEVSEALTALRATGYCAHETWLSALMAEGLAAGGETAAALALVAAAIERCEDSGERWILAELLRVKGVILAGTEVALAGSTAAEALVEALAVARSQDARSLELRCAMTLLRVAPDLSARAEARDRLETVLAGFTEGFATADLGTGRRLLENLV